MDGLVVLFEFGGLGYRALERNKGKLVSKT